MGARQVGASHFSLRNRRKWKSRTSPFLLPCPWLKRAALAEAGTAPLAGNGPGSTYRAGRRSSPCCRGWPIGETPKYVCGLCGEVSLTWAGAMGGRASRLCGCCLGPLNLHLQCGLFLRLQKSCLFSYLEGKNVYEARLLEQEDVCSSL